MNTCTFTPAHRLLSERSDEFWSSYWDSDDFQSYSNTVSAMIEAIKKTDAKRVFVISKDRAWFLAGFFAAIYAGVPVVFPQSDAPELLTDLMQDSDLLLTDQDELAGLAPLFISMNRLPESCSPAPYKPLDPREVVVIFYTSGSAGIPKAVEKKLIQLETEVDVLQKLWGKDQAATFLSTVSHHHLYAFLYSLLWPVCAGFKIVRRTFTYWGDLLDNSSQGDFVISSPAHLGRFSVLDEWVPNDFSHVFSSGALLEFEAATSSQKYLGSMPIEVYGSTETGGIAFRQQFLKNTPWQRFQCIELASGTENKLLVKSPYLDNDEFYQTEDMISWEDQNTFHLLGRADRILKVEGKRVSLIEIEEKLIKIDLITEAAVLLLEKTYRDELGAILVLSQLGKDRLEMMGKLAFIRELRNRLLSYFDAVVIPRKWRFVESMPLNAQGKRQQSNLKKLFADTDRTQLGTVRQPRILKSETDELKAMFSLQIPKDLAYLAGHFNQMPIVPGVVQLNWAVEFARKTFALHGDVTQCNQIKFTNLMKPNDEIILTLEFNPDKSSVSYQYKTAEASYSSGKIRFSRGAYSEL